jgi:hydroxyacylglutathione hydrolase
MGKKLLNYLLFSLLLVQAVNGRQQEKLVVMHQVTGPIETNCYLLYGVQSREAALFDVAGPIETLVNHIRERNLKLKYIFATHCHADHVRGIPMVKKQFPEAKVCFSLEEYEDMPLYMKWEEAMDPKEVEAMKTAAREDPDLFDTINFDLNLIGKPDIFVEDNQTYELGDMRIKTLLSPGHSRGSICYFVGHLLFSGDVLFHRLVGRTDLPKSGGPEAIIKSVRRLYSLLPDDTRVYHGHGEFTDIGSEKKENQEVSADKANVQN